MSRVKWEGQLEDLRLKLRANGYTQKQTAEKLSEILNINITTDMVSSRETAVRKKDNKMRKKYNGYDQFVSYFEFCGNSKISEDIESAQESADLFPKEVYSNDAKYIAANKTKEELKSIWNLFEDGKYKKLLVLSDLHAPYMDFKKVQKAIIDNSDCSICVLNGDIFDGESMSVFDKMEEIDSSEEFDQVFTLLDVLSSRFEYVIWNGGNHDYQRFCKYIIRNIKPGLRNFAFDRLNPMKYISSKYDNVITVNHNTCQIGDVVFKHPNGYSSVEMKTVVSELDVLLANKNDLPNPDFKCVCIGHTHDGGKYFKNGVMLMETCCLCHTPDYRYNNPVKRRWANGYARIELDANGKVVFNKSHVFYLD